MLLRSLFKQRIIFFKVSMKLREYPFYVFDEIIKNYCQWVCDGGGLVTKSCPTIATPWTVAHQAPLSIGFSRQEYWSGLPFPSTGYLPQPRIKPASPASCMAGGFFTA